MVFSAQPLSGIDFSNFTNPPFENLSLLRTRANSRSKLLRSTGSFSVIEENIVAPTPRKIPSVVNSPTAKRALREEALFGEAGAELQGIMLFSSPPSTPKNGDHPGGSTTPTSPIPSNLESICVAEEVIAIMMSRCSSPCVCASPPPQRAANPLPLNSPFYAEGSVEIANKPTIHAHPYQFKIQKSRSSRNPRAKIPLREKQEQNIVPQKPQIARGCQKDSQAGRVRSKSWPALPTVISS